MKLVYKVVYSIKLPEDLGFNEGFMFCVGDSEASAVACVVYDMIQTGVQVSDIHIVKVDHCKLLFCADSYGLKSNP